MAKIPVYPAGGTQKTKPLQIPTLVAPRETAAGGIAAGVKAAGDITLRAMENARVENQKALYQSSMTEIMSGEYAMIDSPDSGFKAERGMAAVDTAPDYVDKWRENSNDVVANISDPVVKQQVQEELARREVSVLARVEAHAFDQGETFKDSASLGYVAGLTNDGVRFAVEGDIYSHEKALGAVMQATAETAARKGLDVDTAKAAVTMEYRTRTLEALIGKKQFDKAKSYLEQHKSEIDSTKAAGWDEALEVGNVENEASEIAYPLRLINNLADFEAEADKMLDAAPADMQDELGRRVSNYRSQLKAKIGAESRAEARAITERIIATGELSPEDKVATLMLPSEEQAGIWRAEKAMRGDAGDVDWGWVVRFFQRSAAELKAVDDVDAYRPIFGENEEAWEWFVKRIVYRQAESGGGGTTPSFLGKTFPKARTLFQRMMANPPGGGDPMKTGGGYELGAGDEDYLKGPLKGKPELYLRMQSSFELALEKALKIKRKDDKDAELTTSEIRGVYESVVTPLVNEDWVNETMLAADATSMESLSGFRVGAGMSDQHAVAIEGAIRQQDIFIGEGKQPISLFDIFEMAKKKEFDKVASMLAGTKYLGRVPGVRGLFDFMFQDDIDDRDVLENFWLMVRTYPETFDPNGTVQRAARGVDNALGLAPTQRLTPVVEPGASGSYPGKIGYELETAGNKTITPWDDPERGIPGLIDNRVEYVKEFLKDQYGVKNPAAGDVRKLVEYELLLYEKHAISHLSNIGQIPFPSAEQIRRKAIDLRRQADMGNLKGVRGTIQSTVAELAHAMYGKGR